MPYALCVIGCGTMGVAVLSGILDNLSSPIPQHLINQDESTSTTPLGDVEAGGLDSNPNK